MAGKSCRGILRRASTNVSYAKVGSISRDGWMQEITKQGYPLIVLEVHAKGSG